MRWAWEGGETALCRQTTGGARPAREQPTRSPPRGASRARGRARWIAAATARRGRPGGGGAGDRLEERRERPLADVAAGEQREQQHERGREEQQPGVEPADVEAQEPQRGEDDDADRRPRGVVRATRHRTGAFTVVVYSSNSETRSVT